MWYPFKTYFNMSPHLIVSRYFWIWTMTFVLLKSSVTFSYEDSLNFDPRFTENYTAILKENLRHASPFENVEEHISIPGNSQRTLESTRVYNPICPEEYDRFDSKTRKCHTIGTTGPCGAYMIFTGNEYLKPDDKTFGHCECDNDSYDRPLVFVGEQCHFLYTQSNCPVGYWLIVSENLGPLCKPNPCINKMTGMTKSINPYIYFKGNCTKLRSPSRLCENKGDIIMFVKGSLEPICAQSKVRRRIYKRQISKVNALKCQSGTIWSRITHKCRPVLQSKVIRE